MWFENWRGKGGFREVPRFSQLEDSVFSEQDSTYTLHLLHTNRHSLKEDPQLIGKSRRSDD